MANLKTARRRLPNSRGSESSRSKTPSASLPRRAHLMMGSLGEIFLQADSTAGIMARDAAIAASLALQFGLPAETLRKALCRDANGNATGPLGIALDLLAEEKRSDAA